MRPYNCLALAAATALLLAAAGCKPVVRVYGEKPVLSHDLSPYHGKRAAVLAFREPTAEPGLGAMFAQVLHRALLQRGPFGQVGFWPDRAWFGLQSRPSEEVATAAAIGSELGQDVAIAGVVEQFVYGRTAESVLVVSLFVVDTTSGEVVYADRIEARGYADGPLPLWEPELSTRPEYEHVMARVALEIARRLSYPEGVPETETDEGDDP